MNDKLILASNSPRRRELLQAAHIDFEVTKHFFDETTVSLNQSPENVAFQIAQGKAMSLGDKHEFDNQFILGVDTVVAFEGNIFGKPRNAQQAEQIIRLLSGKTHQVISGVSLVNRAKNIELTRTTVSHVTFNNLTQRFIDYYLANKQYEGFAGGYAIQGIFSVVVKEIHGSYTNIVGLPMETLYEMLGQIGFQSEF